MGSGRCIEIDFVSYAESVAEALDMAGAAKALSDQNAVLIKPNLINDSPFPITTSPECCGAIVEYIRDRSNAEVVIGEGCGEPSLEMDVVFDRLGYTTIAQQYGVELVDLNNAPCRRMTNSECAVFSEMYLPEIAMTHYLVSVPVLKAHSLADITGTLKNMIGLAPPEHYSGRYGSWKKAVFHGDMHQAIVDLNRYRTPDITLMDASVGMADYHLGGARCNPPVGKLLAGFDPIAIDRRAAELLGFDWEKIGHLSG